MFSLGVPVLGICYGMQYIAKVFAGAIASRANSRIWPHEDIRFTAHPLFEGLGGVVWMNHNDSVTRAPEGFSAIAATDACPAAAFANEERKVYGIQFHAEVTHTQNGQKIFENFLKSVRNLRCDYSAANLKDELIASIRTQAGDKRVIWRTLRGGWTRPLPACWYTRRSAVR